MKITLLLLFVLVVRTSRPQCFGGDDSRIDPNSRFLLYSGQQGFSLALLQAVNQLMPSENLFFSPYSTFHALLIAYFLAGGKTETYLKKVLRLNETNNKNDFYQAYKLDKLQTGHYSIDAKNTIEFTNANKIFVADQISVRSCMKDILGEELSTAPFRSDPQGARRTINGWVEDQTHNMIKDLLPPGSVDQSSTLVLVNAAYFKGQWENKFNPAETKPEIFYVSPTKQIMVDMMHVEAVFNHDVSESLEAHILEMPYKGENISMFVLLPPFTKEDAIDNTLKKLTVEKFHNVVVNNKLSAKTVQVSLPKFSLEQTIELVPILEALGVGNLFQKDADFSGLSANRGVSVGEGVHKAKIVINEQGAQAAAATSVFTWRMMNDEDENPVKFECNRPFAFVIYSRVTHTVLFTGVVRRPA